MGKVIDIHIRVASSIGNHRLRNHVFCQCLCLLVGHCQVVSGRAKNWLILVSFSVFLSVSLPVSLSMFLSVSLSMSLSMSLSLSCSLPWKGVKVGEDDISRSQLKLQAVLQQNIFN